MLLFYNPNSSKILTNSNLCKLHRNRFSLTRYENPADAFSPTGLLVGVLKAPYGTISCTSSFLMGFTRSSRFTPRYMAMAAATNTDE